MDVFEETKGLVVKKKKKFIGLLIINVFRLFPKPNEILNVLCVLQHAFSVPKEGEEEWEYLDDDYYEDEGDETDQIQEDLSNNIQERPK